MNGNKPSILITGANGFVGARLCARFLKENFRVIAGVRQNANRERLDDLEVEYRFGDVTHPESLEAMVAGVDYVVHNAGVVKAKKDETFFEVNEIGTANLLKAIVENNPGVKKVIYISSQAAAGPSQKDAPRKESDRAEPLTVYGRSKLAGERECLSYSEKLPVLSIRPPGIYGPGDREIFSFFQTVKRGIKPHLGDISRKIQLVHVDDLCRGIYYAVTRETKSGEIYFIAENRSYAMAELIDILAKAIGKNGIVIPIPSPLFRALAFVSQTVFKIFNATPMLTVEKAEELLASWEISVEKAKSDLGFESEISFEKGALETYNWYLKEGWL